VQSDGAAAEALEAESADHETFFCAADERLCPVDKAAIADLNGLAVDVKRRV
jgi:hypothetical protein